MLSDETTITASSHGGNTIDHDLVNQAVAGSQAAFVTLVKRHQQRIHSLLERLCGCPETARDLAQETFLSAFRHLHTFEQRSEFFTWLYRIACNHAASANRRRRPHALPVAVASPIAAGTSVSARMEQAELKQRLALALDQLDEGQRQAVVLCDMQGATYEEIAETLDIPVGTVRSRLHRGRMQLRQLVKNL
ncbi:MAG: sigma-70 family RNA polymerase sigma factor [Planctomycetota bacterium]